MSVKLRLDQAGPGGGRLAVGVPDATQPAEATIEALRDECTASPNNRPTPPRSLEAVAAFYRMSTAEFIRRTRDGAHLAEPAADEGCVVQPQFTEVGNPELYEAWTRLEMSMVPAPVAEELVEAARRIHPSVPRAKDILEACVFRQATLARQDRTLVGAAGADAARAVRRRQLRCLMRLGTPDEEAHFAAAAGQDLLFQHVRTAAKNKDMWFSLIASPILSAAIDAVGRCLHAINRIDRDASEPFWQLLDRVENMMRALSPTTGAELLKLSAEVFHERLDALVGQGRPFQWSRVDTEICLACTLHEANQLIDDEWLPALEGRWQWPPAVHRALRATLAQCSSPEAHHLIARLVEKPWFIQLADDDSADAAAIAFSLAVMADDASRSRLPMHIENLENTVAAIFNGTVAIAQHDYTQRQKGYRIFGQATDDGISINSAYYRDPHFGGLSPTLSFLVRHCPPHEVSHALSGQPVEESVAYFEEEYRGFSVGTVGELGRLPNAREAALRTAELLTSSHEAYQHIARAWNRDPRAFDRHLEAIFQCDPRELDGLNRRALAARARRLDPTACSPQWGWPGFEVNEAPPARPDDGLWPERTELYAQWTAPTAH